MTGDKILKQEKLSMTDQERSNHLTPIVQEPFATVQSNFPLKEKPSVKFMGGRVSPPSIEAMRRFENKLIDYPLLLFPGEIFYVFEKKNGFLFENAKPVSVLNPKSNYSLPVIVDTEYVSPEFENIENDDEDSFIEPRRHVTTQFKALYSNRPRVLVHSEFLRAHLKKIAGSDNPYSMVRHPIIRHDQIRAYRPLSFDLKAMTQACREMIRRMKRKKGNGHTFVLP